MEKSFKITFVFWIFILIFFIVKTLAERGYLKQYLELIGKSLEERRELIYGKDLYRFLNFCFKNMPSFSTYKIVGLDRESTEYGRAYYYLYPHINTKNPEFILVYRLNNYKEDNYSLWKKMDEGNFILRRDAFTD